MPEASTSMAFTASTSASATVIATAASGKTALDLEMTDLHDKEIVSARPHPDLPQPHS